LLQVRFAEVQRSALTQLGANFNFVYDAGKDTAQLISGKGVNPTSFGAIAATLTDNTSYSLSASLDALEKNGALRTLAEPNLVALSGDTASFLAGGQIPVPVAQGTTGLGAGGVPIITVQFKDFGVSLSFTPTVVAKEQINLEMVSEVSALDPTLSVVSSGITIPGLKVRRARTTIELKDGQSFS